jgi:hypothetical protein
MNVDNTRVIFGQFSGVDAPEIELHEENLFFLSKILENFCIF